MVVIDLVEESEPKLMPNDSKEEAVAESLPSDFGFELAMKRGSTTSSSHCPYLLSSEAAAKVTGCERYEDVSPVSLRFIKWERIASGNTNALR
jgi:hypothetical protein